jgi:hypothetical protein
MALKRTEAAADARKEAGLEVDARKINYLLMSRDQNAEPRSSLKMGKLKY